MHLLEWLTFFSICQCWRKQRRRTPHINNSTFFVENEKRKIWIVQLIGTDLKCCCPPYACIEAMPASQYICSGLCFWILPLSVILQTSCQFFLTLDSIHYSVGREVWNFSSFKCLFHFPLFYLAEIDFSEKKWQRDISKKLFQAISSFLHTFFRQYGADIGSSFVMEKRLIPWNQMGSSMY